MKTLTLLCILLPVVAAHAADGPSDTPSAPAERSLTTTAGADCAARTVHCVGQGREYRRIQKAVNAARPGDTVLVFPGRYAGFIVRDGGKEMAPLHVRALEGAVIERSYAGTESDRLVGILLFNASDVIIEGFHVTGIPGFGIAARGASGRDPMQRLVLRANRVEQSHSVNIYLSQVAHSLIENNHVSGSTTSHGIYLANGGSDDTRLRGNRSHDNASNGIHFNGDRHESGDGLISGLVVEDNVIGRNRQNGLSMDGVQHSLIRNNLVFGNGRHALRAYIEDASPAEWGEGGGVRDLTIVNNTLLADGPGGWAIKLSGEVGGHVIFNNILLGESREGGSISLMHADYASDHNVITDRFSRDNSETIISHVAWRLRGHDLHSTRATPQDLFRDPGHDDYRLASRAPARDAGVAAFSGMEAPRQALDGAPRPHGRAHDAGAYEVAD